MSEEFRPTGVYITAWTTSLSILTDSLFASLSQHSYSWWISSFDWTEMWVQKLQVMTSLMSKFLSAPLLFDRWFIVCVTRYRASCSTCFKLNIKRNGSKLHQPPHPPCWKAGKRPNKAAAFFNILPHKHFKFDNTYYKQVKFPGPALTPSNHRFDEMEDAGWWKVGLSQ